MRRYAVAFVSMAVGGIVATIDFALGLGQLPAGAIGQPGHLTFPEQRLILDACITCYAVAYAMGKLIYRLIAAKDDLADLQAWSYGHMWLLNTMGGIWLIISGADGFQQAGIVRPSLFVGLLLLVVSVRQGWCGRRNRRSHRSAQTRGHSPRLEP